MGRKIELKKIQNRTKCQVTFSKRRSGLMKIAQEVATFCGVDIALVAFSPSGRLHKYCNKSRIEDVIQRYINLPREGRLIQIRNIQAKLEKLRQLGHIKGYNQKGDHLESQVEKLKFQIRKSNLELQILEDSLCDYEPSRDHSPSLHQLSWSERNLMRSLTRIMARKDMLFGSSSMCWNQPNLQINQIDGSGIMNHVEGGRPTPFQFNEKELNTPPFVRQLQMEMFDQGQGTMSPRTQCSPSFPQHLLLELDPWISPYSPKVRASMFQSLIHSAKGKDICKEEPANKRKGMIAGDDSSFRVRKQPLPPIFNQYGGIKTVEAASTMFQPNHLTNTLCQTGNAPPGFQDHAQLTFGNHMNNPNMQDGSLRVNQHNSNHKQRLDPFSLDHSKNSFHGSRLDFNGVELPQVEFGWEIPLPKDKYQTTEKGLLLDSSHSRLANLHSIFHPNIDTNFSNSNECTSHDVGNSSHAIGQADPAPEAHDARKSENVWTTGIQNNSKLDWDDLINELFSD